MRFLVKLALLISLAPPHPPMWFKQLIVSGKRFQTKEGTKQVLTRSHRSLRQKDMGTAGAQSHHRVAVATEFGNDTDAPIIFSRSVGAAMATYPLHAKLDALRDRGPRPSGVERLCVYVRCDERASLGACDDLWSVPRTPKAIALL